MIHIPHGLRERGSAVASALHSNSTPTPPQSQNTNNSNIPNNKLPCSSSSLDLGHSISSSNNSATPSSNGTTILNVGGGTQTSSTSQQQQAQHHRSTDAAATIPADDDDDHDDDDSASSRQQPRRRYSSWGRNFFNSSSSSNTSGTTITSRTLLVASIVLGRLQRCFFAWIRILRVRWYQLTPARRRFCTIGLLPIVLMLAITWLGDSFYAGRSGGRSDWVDRAKSLNAYDKDFAVVINTYKRPLQLADAVRHYADTCGTKTGINRVYIVWAEQDAAVPDAESFFRSKKMRRDDPSNRAIVSFISVRNSLNSRFQPIAGVDNMAVFMVDDDIRVSCQSLKAGFLAWKTHPYSMVGYYPRLAQFSPKDPSHPKAKAPVYQSWPIVYWRSQLNFILTKACFLHSRYMTAYSDPLFHPVEILNYIDTHFNCEDVAMSLMVANITKTETENKPIYVEGSISDKGLFNGISTTTGHMAKRSDCLQDLTAIYEQNGWGVPLEKTVSLRSSSWRRHLPGAWWLSRPSNFFEWLAVENIFK